MKKKILPNVLHSLVLGVIFLLIATILTYLRNEYYFLNLAPCSNKQAEQQSLLGRDNCVSESQYQHSALFYGNHLNVLKYSLQNLYFISIFLTGLIISLTLKKSLFKTTLIFIFLILLVSQNTAELINPAKYVENGADLSSKDISFLRNQTLSSIFSSIPNISIATISGVLLGKFAERFLPEKLRKNLFIID